MRLSMGGFARPLSRQSLAAPAAARRHASNAALQPVRMAVPAGLASPKAKGRGFPRGPFRRKRQDQFLA